MSARRHAAPQKTRSWLPTNASGRAAVLLLLAGLLATLAGVVALWPTYQPVQMDQSFTLGSGASVPTERGEVVSTEVGPCGSPDNGRVLPGPPLAPRTPTGDCPRSIVRLTSGPEAGGQVLLEIQPGPGTPDLAAGDGIEVNRTPTANGGAVYSFSDFTRTVPLLLWLVLAVVVMVAVGAWKGLRAVLGLALALGVVVGFVLPSILDGRPAALVAVVGCAAVLYAVIYLVHGINLKTHAALLGTLTSMLLAALLGWLAVVTTDVTGLSGDHSAQVQVFLRQVSVSGLLLAGIVIGTLGVLNDVTVSQAAVVFELRRLDPAARAREVFRAAIGVGRDHIASMVYTLVLAYTGSALPLLLLFSVGTRSVGSILTSDVVAVELLRSLVGAITLAAGVPLTSAIALWLSRGATDADLARATEGGHAHTH